MKVSELSSNKDFTVLSMPSPDREINGAYVGDLLSWVMGRAKEGDAWVTIMSNVNIIAVCSLADPSCIVLSEGVSPDPEALKRAEEQGVNILSTSLDTFSACARIASLL
jgi:predicted transcriptional regulator